MFAEIGYFHEYIVFPVDLTKNIPANDKILFNWFSNGVKRTPLINAEKSVVNEFAFNEEEHLNYHSQDVSARLSCYLAKKTQGVI